MEPIISVRGLGKSYRIQSGERKPYRTLRDDIADFGKGLLKGQWGSSQTEEFWALKDIDFDIYPGEVVGIIGRNGAGKSTLLKILSRVIQPTSGEAILRGRVSSLLEVGTGFHPELTGRENVYISGAILGMRKAEIQRKFDEIVEFAEIEKFLDTPVKRYSSGMYVRLAFAVAAHLEPEILIVDEVLAVGDTQFQKKCLGKMEDVSKAGRTILFVSHNMGAICNLCQTGLLLSEGKILNKDMVSRIIEQYIEFHESNTEEVIARSNRSRSENSRAKLISARAYSGDQVGDQFTISQDIVIEIVYENLEQNSLFYSSIHLKDSFGNCILASVNFPSGTLLQDEFSSKRLPKGKIISRCILPKNFLNDIAYTVNILILSHEMNVEVMCEDALRFTIIDTGEMRKEFTGHWIGAIRPKLFWKTSFL